MQRYSRRKIARATVTLLDTHPLKRVVKMLAPLLTAQGERRHVDQLVQAVAYELLVRRGHLMVSVQSAHPFSASQKATLKRVLQVKTAAKTVAASFLNNPAIKGGFTATTPLGELDASVATKLNQLKA